MSLVRIFNRLSNEPKRIDRDKKNSPALLFCFSKTSEPNLRHVRPPSSSNNTAYKCNRDRQLTGPTRQPPVNAAADTTYCAKKLAEEYVYTHNICMQVRHLCTCNVCPDSVASRCARRKGRAIGDGTSEHLFHHYRKEAADDHNPFVNTGPGDGNQTTEMENVWYKPHNFTFKLTCLVHTFIHGTSVDATETTRRAIATWRGTQAPQIKMEDARGSLKDEHRDVRAELGSDLL